MTMRDLPRIVALLTRAWTPSCTAGTTPNPVSVPPTLTAAAVAIMSKPRHGLQPSAATRRRASSRLRERRVAPRQRAMTAA